MKSNELSCLIKLNDFLFHITTKKDESYGCTLYFVFVIKRGSKILLLFDEDSAVAICQNYLPNSSSYLNPDALLSLLIEVL